MRVNSVPYLVNTSTETIANELHEIAAAIKEQNEILRACVIHPEGQAPRVAVGIVGAVGALEL